MRTGRVALLLSTCAVTLVAVAMSASLAAASLRPRLVSAHPISLEAPPQPTTASDGNLEQSIELRIIGGDLDVSPAMLMVTIEPGSSVAEVPSMTIVDARGTLEGWRLRGRIEPATGPVSAIAPARGASLQATSVDVVDGSDAGVTIRKASRGHGWGTLVDAEEGNGGGTYLARARIELRRPVQDATTVVISLSVD